MTTGERIRSLRMLKGLSQSELGSLIGVQNAAIYKYEHGIIENLPRERIEALAKALCTTPAYLLCLIEDPDPKLNYNELVQQHIQMEKEVLAETKDSLDKAIHDREQADKRLLAVAHKICFSTPEHGVTYPEGEEIIGPLNAIRLDVITGFIADNEKTLKVLLNAADDAQWESESVSSGNSSSDLPDSIFSIDD